MRSKKLVKNSFFSLLQQVVSLIAGFIVPIYLIKSFGSNTYGLTVSITQFLAYISLLESGFGPVVKSVLYKPIANKNKQEITNILKSSDNFFKKISYIFIIYVVVLSLIYPFIVIKSFGYFFTFSLVIIIGISTFFSYFYGMTYSLYLQAEQKTYITSIIQIITYILNTIIIVVLVKLKFNIHIIKLTSSLIYVLRPIMQNVYVTKKYNINLEDSSSNYEIKQKWDGLAQHVAAVVNGNTDIVVLTLFSPLQNTAIYSVYNLIMTGIKNIIIAFTGGVDASFGDMIAKNEKETLNRSFKSYEFFYYTLITIIYSCTLILIIPFITIYTKNITDANYINSTFGYLITLATFMYSIRIPYSSLTLAAGHFKETKKGAWVEAFSNLIISIILVKKHGLIGVTIGTFIAMFIRTIEFMYHASKKILNISLWNTYKRLVIIAIQVIIILFISKYISMPLMTGYLNWSLYAIKIFAISSIVVISINSIIYNEELKNSIKIFRNLFKRKKVNE